MASLRLLLCAVGIANLAILAEAIRIKPKLLSGPSGLSSKQQDLSPQDALMHCINNNQPPHLTTTWEKAIQDEPSRFQAGNCKDLPARVSS